VLDVALNVDHAATGVALVPVTVQVLGRGPKLDDQIARQVLRPDFATFLLPKPDQGGLVIAQDDAGIRASDKISSIDTLRPMPHPSLPPMPSAAWMAPIASATRSPALALLKPNVTLPRPSRSPAS
jgi:hypothetical protein